MRLTKILIQAARGYVANDALSRGAAISFYVVTSLAPVLLIVTAVAGLIFGRDAVSGRLVDQLSVTFGKQGGELIQTILAHNNDVASSATASILGIVTIMFTASGVFGEIQAGLNRIWNVKTSSQPWFSLVRARAASFGLVAALGFLMMVSLSASTAVTAFGTYMGAYTAFAPTILSVLNTTISLFLFTLLFAAIFKVLPDAPIAWKHVLVGSFITATLFTVGKSLIGWYLGTTAVSSGYGAAGALILILLWSYYSAQILLIGAEITRAVSDDTQGGQGISSQ